jgi:hypothetical protein
MLEKIAFDRKMQVVDPKQVDEFLGRSVLRRYHKIMQCKSPLTGRDLLYPLDGETNYPEFVAWVKELLPGDDDKGTLTIVEQITIS